jgi:hypothetical protein
LFISQITKEGLAAPPGWVRSLPFYTSEDEGMRGALNAWFKLYVKNPISRDRQSRRGGSFRNWVQDTGNEMRLAAWGPERTNETTGKAKLAGGKDVWAAYGGKIFQMTWKQLDEFCRARCVYFPWPMPD